MRYQKLGGSALALTSLAAVASLAHGGVTVNEITMIDLPAARAADIGAGGKVVGAYADTQNGRPVARPFILERDEAPRPVPGLPPGWCEATGVSDLGHITGWSFEDGFDRASGFVRFPSGISTGIPSLDGAVSVGAAVNRTGAAAGWSSFAGVVRALSHTPDHATHNLGVLSPQCLDWSFAHDINDDGDVVGWSYDKYGQTRAFLHTTQTGMIDLGDLGGGFAQAMALNNNGVVVGWSRRADGLYRAFRWTQATGMRELGSLGGPGSCALDVNDSNVIVGWSHITDDAVRGFLWTHGDGMVNVDPFIASRARVDLVEIVAINDENELAGNVMILDGSSLFGRPSAVRFDVTLSPPLPGDLNRDGVITSSDLSIMLTLLGGTDPRADFNKDGVVNYLDMNILLATWSRQRA